MKKILLFKTAKNLTNKRDLYVIFHDNGDITLDGCDSGPIVKENYGDFDYEYTLTIKSGKKRAFANLLKELGEDTKNIGIADYIKQNYSHENGFNEFKELLDNHNFEYKYWFHV